MLDAGLVAAPFPFIAGVHSSYYEHIDLSVCEEAAKVYLDEDRIDFGELGPPPALPERRSRKLFHDISTVGKIFECRGHNWKEDRRPFFDDAFSSTSDRPASTVLRPEKAEELLRSAFLKFFVAVLKNYRR